MDYAFAPGTTGYDNIMKDLFRRRPNTTLINQAGVSRVDHLVNHLATNVGVTRPVGNILAASHGNDGGWMQIQFANIDTDGDGVPEVNTTYEVLEIADNTNVADIPAPVLGAGTQFHIKGCKIGQAFAVPFVQKFKAALGGIVPVTAPKHFHEVWFRTDLGVLEFLGYDFSIVRPTAFANRAAVVAAFQARGFTFVDGANVPNAKWNAWIPTKVNPGRRARPVTVGLNPSLQPNTGSALTSLRLANDTGFRHDLETFTFTITYGGGALPPAGDAARKAEMKTSMGGLAKFQVAHPFPIYKRYEHNSLNEFVDGFTWVFNYNATRHIMRCVGTRHKYTVIVPITDDPTNANNLFFNFYPFAGNATPVVTQLLENDARFFLTV
ncbi:MAG: hypothetical protein EPO28_17495 [Saprospiraceae bacterium]|nr:MAG: hypothetical protein EPO28_17495 [Saprospiraceae bacterium]